MPFGCGSQRASRRKRKHQKPTPESMTISRPKLLKAALKCFEANQPIVAVGPDKRPYRNGWNEYFSRPQTVDEVREQFSNGAHGIARILHPASKYLCLDF